MDFGFVEAFARGNEIAMQKVFEKLGFTTYGVAPRFEVVHFDEKNNPIIIREQFVHLGLTLKPETIDEKGMDLIAGAKKIYDLANKKIIDYSQQNNLSNEKFPISENRNVRRLK